MNSVASEPVDGQGIRWGCTDARPMITLVPCPGSRWQNIAEVCHYRKMAKLRRRRRLGRSDSANGRTFTLVAGILGTQLAAVAINSATSTADLWPFGLEHVRQHPFGWSAALTALLAICGLATARMERRNAQIMAHQVAEKVLFLQLRELKRHLENIRVLINWCLISLDTTLSGTRSSVAIEAKDRIANLETSIARRSVAVGDLVNRIFGQLRTRGGLELAIPGVRSAPAVTRNEARINHLLNLPEAQGQSILATAIPIVLVIEHLNQLEREVGDLRIDIAGAQGQIDCLPRVAGNDYSLVPRVAEESDGWSQDLATSASLLGQYLTASLRVDTASLP